MDQNVKLSPEDRPKPRRGRARKVIDWALVDSLCEIQCTGPEIARIVGVDNDTMTSACKRDKHMLFSEYIKIKSENGRKSLRRKMYEMAMAGNTAMAIFLAKNWLGMSDHIQNDIKADNITIEIK